MNRLKLDRSTLLPFGYIITNCPFMVFVSDLSPDFNLIEKEELDKLMGVDTLVICALRKTPHISHLNLAGALELIAKIGPRKAYLTHMSHEMGKHDDLLAELPANVEPAYDGLVLEV